MPSDHRIPPSEIVRRASEAFRDDVASPPPMTLRGGNSVDSYRYAEPYDSTLDEPTDAYLEANAFWGLVYLDARSWRHYVPRLIEYTLRRPDDPAMVAEAFVASLRPPDRYPPRLGALTAEQETVIREFLELIALGDPAPHLKEDAVLALEEWWLPNPRSRPTPEQIQAARSASIECRITGDGVYRLALPVTLAGGGARDIPEEARRVEVWGGYLCGDAHTTVAVNVRPVAVGGLSESVRRSAARYQDAVNERRLKVRGARDARRLDGIAPGDSPAEPHELTTVLASTGDAIVELTIRTWPRDDVRRAVERIVESFEIAAAG